MSDLNPDERAALLQALRDADYPASVEPLQSEQAIWRASRAFWLERAAKECELTRDQVSLRSGELSRYEWLAVKAILADRARTIRALAQDPLSGSESKG